MLQQEISVVNTCYNSNNNNYYVVNDATWIRKSVGFIGGLIFLLYLRHLFEDSFKFGESFNQVNVVGQ